MTNSIIPITSASAEPVGSTILDAAAAKMAASNGLVIGWRDARPNKAATPLWAGLDADSDGSNLILGAGTGRLYTSTDYGLHWTERRPAGDVDQDWYAAASDSDGSNLIAASWDGRLWTSSDGGASWTERRPAGDADAHWRAVASDGDGSVLLAATDDARCWLSIDSGANWTEVRPDGVDEDKNWTTVASDSDGSVLVVATYGSAPGPLGKVWVSIDSGATWIERLPEAQSDGYYMANCNGDGSRILAVGPTGRLHLSSDQGASWTELTPTGVSETIDWYGIEIDFVGDVLFVCAYDGRLYASIDGGHTWSEQQPAGDEDLPWVACALSDDGATFVAASSAGSCMAKNVADFQSRLAAIAEAVSGGLITGNNQSGMFLLIRADDGSVSIKQVTLTAPPVGGFSTLQVANP